MSCPQCGNNGVVSKEDAWDAARETPHSVQMELDRLRDVEKLARELFSGTYGPDSTDPVYALHFPAHKVTALRLNLGLPPV
jgi:hypothetical protein